MIKLLPDSVANQIAAGEVVDRPASVVKELMENAVDAGSRQIMVNFRDGGRELIQIKDDGIGMSSKDARMAFERHATSKIVAVDDIYSLATFGFRGEALPSIAAVSQIEMQTRTEGQEFGTQLFIDGGALKNSGNVAAAKGTQIFVRNLFYNVPARKKFLDKGSTEAAHVMSEFQRVALAHPDVAFQLFRDDTQIYNLPAGSLYQRVVGIAGKNAATKLLEVSVETSIIRVFGFIGRPSSAVRRNKEQFLFVNGRFFKSTFFHRAVVQAYDKLISFAVQPSYFLYFDISPELIDVNVHPQKTEVKFTDQAAVWQIINAAVRETLAKSGSVPMMDFDVEDAPEIPVIGASGEGSVRFSEPPSTRREGYNPFAPGSFDRSATGGSDGFDRSAGDAQTGWRTDRRTGSRTDYSLGAERQEWAPRENFEAGNLEMANSERSGEMSQFEYVDPETGEVLQRSFAEFEAESGFTGITLLGDGYAAALRGGVFVVVDLRRAREAVLFDRFSTMLSSGRSATQQLLFPEKIVLSADDLELLKDNSEEFSACGFDIRTGGDNSAEILGVPSDMPSERTEDAVFEILDAIREGTFAGEETRRERLATIMARAGAGYGARMSHSEAEGLLMALSATRNPTFTPAGRPVFVEIPLDEIRYKLR